MGHRSSAQTPFLPASMWAMIPMLRVMLIGWLRFSDMGEHSHSEDAPGGSRERVPGGVVGGEDGGGSGGLGVRADGPRGGHGNGDYQR